MFLSVPVAFQYPEAAALFGLAPFGYFRSLGLKKYHSFSPNAALAVEEPQQTKKHQSSTSHTTKKEEKKIKTLLVHTNNTRQPDLTWYILREIL